MSALPAPARPATPVPTPSHPVGRPDQDRWIALPSPILTAPSCSSNLVIALCDIFGGIRIDQFAPRSTAYLPSLIFTFMVLTSVLAVLGRLGDMRGRVRMYKLGYAMWTFSPLLFTHAPRERPYG